MKGLVQMNLTNTIGRRLRAWMLFAGLALLIPRGVSAAFLYDVSIDTAGLAGSTGYIDLQFNPGVSPPAAVATLSLFDLGGGSLGGAPIIDGDVTGSPLPGPLTFGNSTGFNAIFQPVTFGSTIAFRLGFDGAFLADASPAQTLFSVNVLGADGITPLLDIDPVLQASAAFELASAKVTDHIFTPGDITPVPEPRSLALLAAGLVALTAATRARRSVAR